MRGMVIENMKNKKSQMKIQQMAFMIIAVFFFFILVGLFFIGWQYKDVMSSYEKLQKEQAISSMAVISDMAELNCGSQESYCLDEDKLIVMGRKNFQAIWPVESVEVYKIYPEFSEEIACPSIDCNYWKVYDSGRKNTEKHSTFVSICRKIKEKDFIYEKCEIGKLLVGVRLLDNAKK